MNQEKLRILLNKRIKESGSVRKCARDIGCSAGLVSKCARGLEKMPPRIMEYLGYERVCKIVRKNDL